MDTRIEKLHRQIYNREMAVFPTPNKPAYIPDPVKWNRLNKIQKLQHIARAYEFLDGMERLGRLHDEDVAEMYSSRSKFYRNIVVPPGFDSVQDYLGAIVRDRFGSNFEYE